MNQTIYKIALKVIKNKEAHLSDEELAQEIAQDLTVQSILKNLDDITAQHQVKDLEAVNALLEWKLNQIRSISEDK